MWAESEFGLQLTCNQEGGLSDTFIIHCRTLLVCIENNIKKEKTKGNLKDQLLAHRCTHACNKTQHKC